MRPSRPQIVALVAFALSACGSAAPAVSRLPPASDPVAGRTVVAFGDSLTAGLGVTEEESYPAQLERTLATNGVTARVVSAGVSGDTSADALGRLDWTLRESPDVAIVVIGANDGLRGLGLAQLEENLTAIVERFQSAGTHVLLGGMRVPPNYGARYSSDFAAIYPRVAERTGATLIPFFLEGVAGTPSLNQVDGIHPTAAGYRKIVDDVVWPVLGPLLGA